MACICARPRRGAQVLRREARLPRAHGREERRLSLATVQHPDQPSFQLGSSSRGRPCTTRNGGSQALREVVAKGAMPPLLCSCCSYSAALPTIACACAEWSSRKSRWSGSATWTQGFAIRRERMEDGGSAQGGVSDAFERGPLHRSVTENRCSCSDGIGGLRGAQACRRMFGSKVARSRFLRGFPRSGEARRGGGCERSRARWTIASLWTCSRSRSKRSVEEGDTIARRG